MQCPECKGAGEVLVYGVLTGEIDDLSTDYWECDECGGTGEVPPEVDEATWQEEAAAREALLDCGPEEWGLA